MTNYKTNEEILEEIKLQKEKEKKMMEELDSVFYEFVNSLNS